MTQRNNLHTNGAGIQTIRCVQKDILGPNCEVGLKLKALYASIQDETIPDQFLDLLEKLDQAEQESMRGQNNRSVG
ncbi:NepR family anti-sigma factor [Brucella suis]|uniref:NepR family anti-sigma factor n=1 Tax=Brucella suis TaxID=29461 RepID=UPI0001B480B9|nr:NepR family anti-sigma factor [Brucella suis]AIJ68624.1 putative rNA polymerase [Brucella suis]QOK67551.1 RNA polymerase [Brucella suis bv. 5]